MNSIHTLLPLVNAGSSSSAPPGPKEWLVAGLPPSTGSQWILLLLLFLLFLLRLLPRSSLSLSALDSRPFHPPACLLAWKSRPAPSHTLLICFTSLAMCLLNLFSCVSVSVCLSFSHSLVFFSSASCCFFPSLHPPVCCGISPPSRSLLVGQCQGVRGGQQVGMGMMGGVLVAVTVWRAWWRGDWRPESGRRSRDTCSPEDWGPASEFRPEQKSSEQAFLSLHQHSD